METGCERFLVGSGPMHGLSSEDATRLSAVGARCFPPETHGADTGYCYRCGERVEFGSGGEHEGQYPQWWAASYVVWCADCYAAALEECNGDENTLTLSLL